MIFSTFISSINNCKTGFELLIAGTPKKTHKRVEDNKKERADSEEGHNQTIVSRGNHPRGINRLSSKPSLGNPLMMMIFLL